MAVVIPVISAEQGGQGAVTFYGFGPAPHPLAKLQAQAVQSAKQGAPLVEQVLTPAFPSIVHEPVYALPTTLTPPLPSMTPGQVTPGTGMTCQMNQAYRDAEEEMRGGWECKLSRWVGNNPLTALGVIALAYVVTHGKKR